MHKFWASVAAILGLAIIIVWLKAPKLHSEIQLAMAVFSFLVAYIWWRWGYTDGTKRRYYAPAILWVISGIIWIYRLL